MFIQFPIKYKRGCSLESIVAEAFSKKSGLNKGKGGNVHLTRPQTKFFAGFGLVGSQLPIGTGAAFAIKYRGDNEVCLTSYGDGASNQVSSFFFT